MILENPNFPDISILYTVYRNPFAVKDKIEPVRTHFFRAYIGNFWELVKETPS